ncbi:hypothetical protein PCE1_003578 [Barthelona sp. PCE]
MDRETVLSSIRDAIDKLGNDTIIANLLSSRETLSFIPDRIMEVVQNALSSTQAHIISEKDREIQELRSLNERMSMVRSEVDKSRAHFNDEKNHELTRLQVENRLQKTQIGDMKNTIADCLAQNKLLSERVVALKVKRSRIEEFKNDILASQKKLVVGQNKKISSYVQQYEVIQRENIALCDRNANLEKKAEKQATLLTVIKSENDGLRRNLADMRQQVDEQIRSLEDYKAAHLQISGERQVVQVLSAENQRYSAKVGEQERLINQMKQRIDMLEYDCKSVKASLNSVREENVQLVTENRHQSGELTTKTNEVNALKQKLASEERKYRETLDMVKDNQHRHLESRYEEFLRNNFPTDLFSAEQHSEILKAKQEILRAELTDVFTRKLKRSEEIAVALKEKIEAAEQVIFEHEKQCGGSVREFVQGKKDEIVKLELRIREADKDIAMLKDKVESHNRMLYHYVANIRKESEGIRASIEHELKKSNHDFKYIVLELKGKYNLLLSKQRDEIIKLKADLALQTERDQRVIDTLMHQKPIIQEPKMTETYAQPIRQPAMQPVMQPATSRPNKALEDLETDILKTLEQNKLLEDMIKSHGSSSSSFSL